ncbi:copper-binding protein [Salmonella enterica subsp. enterica serovar Heidelberg]|nr:copper-binding protein [Salmonella enterica subsp. enterica serovar Heidelberg]
MMNNGDAFAHQQMAQTQKPSAPATVENATSFSEMDDYEKPRFYVSTSKSIIKALINMHSFEIQLSPIG